MSDKHFRLQNLFYSCYYKYDRIHMLLSINNFTTVIKKIPHTEIEHPRDIYEETHLLVSQ